MFDVTDAAAVDPAVDVVVERHGRPVALLASDRASFCNGEVLTVVDGQVLGAGRNRRGQDRSVIHHGETNALELAGRRSADVHGR